MISGIIQTHNRLRQTGLQTPEPADRATGQHGIPGPTRLQTPDQYQNSIYISDTKKRQQAESNTLRTLTIIPGVDVSPGIQENLHSFPATIACGGGSTS